MANLISKLLSVSGDTDAIAKLQTVLSENQKDEAEIDSWAKRVAHDVGQLNDLRVEFGKSAKREIGERIIALHTKIEAQREILCALSRLAHEPIKARILARTRPAVKAALETVRDRLTAELEESNKRDAQFAGETVRRIGGVISGGLASPEDLRQQEKSAVTMTIEAALSRANGYLDRLDSVIDESKLRGPIEFCLGDGSK